MNVSYDWHLTCEDCGTHAHESTPEAFGCLM